MSTWNTARVMMILLAVFLAGFTAGESRGKLTVNLIDCLDGGTVRSTR